tara:strand:+ start:93 stop:332 length:240 start_codon:yes stop_codon:yes gene_type:complete
MWVESARRRRSEFAEFLYLAGLHIGVPAGFRYGEAVLLDAASCKDGFANAVFEESWPNPLPWQRAVLYARKSPIFSPIP